VRLLTVTATGLSCGLSTFAQLPKSEFGFDDFLIAGLRIHLLSAKNTPGIETTLTEEDLARIISKVNGVWAQAGLHFYVESIVREEAVSQETYAESAKKSEPPLLPLCPSQSKATNLFNFYFIKTMSVNGIYFPEGIFVKDTASLRKVEGGIDEPIPRVSSHELGHALGLWHRQNTTNLMASGTTGIWLNQDEIRQARETARNIAWFEPASAIMSKANTLSRKRRREEARRLYSKLATIPLRVEEVELARKRAATSR